MDDFRPVEVPALPKVSVVTVCFNSADIIQATLESVVSQDYPNIEYVVVDGNSSDGTCTFLQQYSSHFGCLVSEPDCGVYDAMNKAVKLATGEYLLFMNAGDVFYSRSALRDMLEKSRDDVIYADFNYLCGPRKGRVVADFSRGIFNHQSVLYRRQLHDIFGGYLSIKGLTAADYLFFMAMQASTTKVSFAKVDTIVASVDPYGMSAGAQTFLQVGLVDCLLQRRARYPTVIRIAVHPLFNGLRKLFRRFK